MKPPTIFISSTVYDFRDLRSSLKYYLEQQGCKVLASEFNDFQKPLDRHSYDACLAAIRQSDFFILLIGSRVGGLYDPKERISITQMEYRTAYDLHVQGRLNILTFVRRDVWQVREDRKALERHLTEQHFLEIEKKNVMDFPSKFATDSEFISSFIDEVGKNRETRSALEDGLELPTGNWIHVFTDFGDIIGAISPLLYGGLPISEAAFRKNLEVELVDILSQCMLKDKKGVMSPTQYRNIIDIMLVEHPINAHTILYKEIGISTKYWDLFSGLLLAMYGKHIGTVVLPNALSSPYFFKFSTESGSLRDTNARKALARLLSEIKAFNRVNERDTFEVILSNVPIMRSDEQDTVYIPGSKLVLLYQLSFRWGNIVLLCMALVRHLRGGTYIEPDLFPMSPIEGADSKLKDERPSAIEIYDFIDDQYE